MHDEWTVFFYGVKLNSKTLSPIILFFDLLHCFKLYIHYIILYTGRILKQKYGYRKYHVLTSCLASFLSHIMIRVLQISLFLLIFLECICYNHINLCGISKLLYINDSISILKYLKRKTICTWIVLNSSDP